MFRGVGGIASAAFTTVCFFGFLPAATQGLSGVPADVSVVDAPPQLVAMYLANFADEAEDGDRDSEPDTEDLKEGADEGEGSSRTAPAVGDAASAEHTLASTATNAPAAAGGQVGVVVGRVDGRGVAPQQRKRSTRKRCGQHENPEIKSLGGDNWLVTRDIVDHHTQSLSHIMSLGWSGSYNEEGVKGWQVSGFTCKSDLYIGGLRRKDVILTVNGKPTKNVIQLYGMYKKLKRKDAFEIVVIRKGKRRTLRYVVVEDMPGDTA